MANFPLSATLHPPNTIPKSRPFSSSRIYVSIYLGYLYVYICIAGFTYIPMMLRIVSLVGIKYWFETLGYIHGKRVMELWHGCKLSIRDNESLRSATHRS